MAADDDTYALTLVRGTTYTRVLSATIDGTPVDFRQWAAAGQLRAEDVPAAPVLLDLGPYLTPDVVDGTTLTLTIPGAVTATLPIAPPVGRLRGPLDVDDGPVYRIVLSRIADPGDVEPLLDGPVTIDTPYVAA